MVDIKEVWRSMKRVASYCVEQYIFGQSGIIGRFSTSRGWTFPKFRGYMRLLVKKFGFKDGLLKWRAFLFSRVKPLKKDWDYLNDKENYG